MRTLLIPIVVLWLGVLAGCGGVEESRSPLVPPGANFSPMVTTQNPTSPIGPITPTLKSLFPPAENNYVVELVRGANAIAVASALNLSVLDDDGNGYALFEGSSTAEQIETHPHVVSADTNQKAIFGDDQDYTLGFLEQEFSLGTMVQQTALRTLQLDQFPPFATGFGQMVAVLDSGVDPNHPLFDGRLVLVPPSSDLTSLAQGNGIDDDNDGLVDEGVHHGTHVSGIVAQMGEDVLILPVRVLNSDGVGSMYDIIRGLFFAQSAGADVVNLSLRLSQPSILFERAMRTLRQDSIILVAAAGNSEHGPAAYPASSSLAIGVLATDNTNQAAGFSSVGGLVSTGAPGVGILSAMPHGKMAGLSGTSMATPIVSGLIAVLSQGLNLHPGASVQALFDDGYPLNPEHHSRFGRVDPVASFQRLMMFD